MTDGTLDVVVSGAGVIGLACAFRLSRDGKKVILFDHDATRLGASLGNAGRIATEQVFPLPRWKLCAMC